MLPTVQTELPEASEPRLEAQPPVIPVDPNPDARDVIGLVLQMLRDRMGMDVVFVSAYSAASATKGTPLSVPIVLHDGRVYGMLCCFVADSALADRDLRSLRYSARLAARLLDNLQVLRDLARKSIHH